MVLKGAVRKTFRETALALPRLKLAAIYAMSCTQV